MSLPPHHLLIVDSDPSALFLYQVKAAPHWLRHYLFDGYRHLSGELFFFGVPFVLGMSPFLLLGTMMVTLSIKAIASTHGRSALMNTRTAKLDTLRLVDITNGQIITLWIRTFEHYDDHIFNFATRATSNFVMNSVYLFRLSSTPGALAGSSTLTIGFHDTTDTFVERRYHH